MVGIPIIKSKLNMPQLSPSICISKRIMTLCEKMLNSSVTSISAPAGYGKSTLMITALTQNQIQGKRICWYHFDENDKNLGVFYAHLAEALFPESDFPESKISAFLLECGDGDMVVEYKNINTLICQKIWDHHIIQPKIKTYIAFDDFHQIIDTPEIINSISFFIDNLPDNYSIIISSRCDTGLLNGKRKLAENVLEINHTELCFSQNETSAIIKSRFQIEPENDLLNKIMLYTEGWPAGIILVCQSIVPGKSGLTADFKEKTVTKESLFRYAFSEVFSKVDDSILNFLVKVALFPEVSSEEAITIFDDGQAHDSLEKCYQKGLFIQKIAGERTVYRLHSLFREALKQLLPKYLTQKDISDLYIKAAEYFIKNKFFAKAIESFILSGNTDLAVKFITKESVNYMAFEAVNQLRYWLKFLPEEVIQNNGYLLYIKAFVSFQKSPDLALQLLEKALLIFESAKIHEMQISTLISMSFLYFLRNNLKNMKWIHNKIIILSDNNHNKDLNVMLSVLDFNLAVWEENFSKAILLFQALKSKELVNDWRFIVLIRASGMYCLMGDYRLAEDYICEALALNVADKSELLKVYTLLEYSVTLIIDGKTDRLNAILDEIFAIAKKYDYTYILGYGSRLAAIASYHRHDINNALSLLDTSNCFFHKIGNTAMISSNNLYRCLWLCGKRSSTDLLKIAKKAYRTIALSPTTGACLAEIGLSILGAVAGYEKDIDLAIKSINSAIKKAKSKEALHIIAGAYLHLAKIYIDSGAFAQGESYLRRGLDIAADKKYMTFWDNHFPTLIALSLYSIKSNIHIEYIRSLIVKHFGNEAFEYLRTEVVTENVQTIDILNRFMAFYCSEGEFPQKRVYVNLFGKFRISINGITIPDSEWKTKKITGVLKYLLIFSSRTISKDRLMEAFWPEANRKQASTSLRSALYELKKVLAKYGMSTRLISLIFDEKKSLIDKGNELILDTDLFLSYNEKLRNLSKDDLCKRKDTLEKLVDLYRGDLLEEDLYDDWTFADREEYKSIFIDSFLELADIYIKNSEHDKAEKHLLKMLSIDQYNEDACKCLIELYIAKKQKSRAIRLYSVFTKRFENDLGIKPDIKLPDSLKKTNR